MPVYNEGEKTFSTRTVLRDILSKKANESGIIEQVTLNEITDKRPT